MTNKQVTKLMQEGLTVVSQYCADREGEAITNINALTHDGTTPSEWEAVQYWKGVRDQASNIHAVLDPIVMQVKYGKKVPS